MRTFAVLLCSFLAVQALPTEDGFNFDQLTQQMQATGSQFAEIADSMVSLRSSFDELRNNLGNTFKNAKATEDKLQSIVSEANNQLKGLSDTCKEGLEHDLTFNLMEATLAVKTCSDYQDGLEGVEQALIDAVEGVGDLATAIVLLTNATAQCNTWLFWKIPGCYIGQYHEIKDDINEAKAKFADIIKEITGKTEDFSQMSSTCNSLAEVKLTQKVNSLIAQASKCDQTEKSQS